MPRLLFCEDDANLLHAIGFILEREGFTVDSAPSGERALEMAAASPPDLVLLDVSLPGVNGFEVCQRLKRTPSTAGALVVLLTARGEVDDIVHGLECLADDYVTKPCHPRVLVARLHALLRRAGKAAPSRSAPVKVGDLRIDPEGRMVWVQDARVCLTRAEFDLLRLLVAHTNQVLSREQILDRISDDALAIAERAVDVQVSGLRKKLGCAGRYLETVRGVGYRFSV